MIMAGHEILKFVCYPISKEPDASGKYQINWVAERHMPPTYQWRREDYNRTAKLEEFLPWFENWKFDWLDVPGLIRNCPHAYEYPLVDRDPIPQWTFGRVTLMGDAAHPMYPIGSNGASQAILDARVITREILAQGATHAALRGLRSRAPAGDHRPRDAQPPQRARAGDADGRGARARRLQGRHRRAVAAGAGRHRRQLQARRRLPGRRPQRQAADRDDAGAGKALQRAGSHCSR